MERLEESWRQDTGLLGRTIGGGMIVLIAALFLVAMLLK